MTEVCPRYYIEQGFFLAIIFKEAWVQNMSGFCFGVKEVLSSLLPGMQPQWLKGMTTVILTYAIVSDVYISVCCNTPFLSCPSVS